MSTPTRQVLQRGTYANDGTGDTLRDAAQKINDNFTYLWDDVYGDEVKNPGRGFVFAKPNGTEPDSGQFTILKDDLGVDSDQEFRMSRWDKDDKSFKTNATITSPDSTGGFSLSMWSLDSGSYTDYNLIARYQGSVLYDTVNANWQFTKTNTLLASTDTLDSGKTYYIKLDGVW